MWTIYRGRSCKFWKVQTTTVAALYGAKPDAPPPFDDGLMPLLTVLLIYGNGTGLCEHNRHSPVYLFKHVLQRRRLLRLLIAYTDFVEGLQKYFERRNTAVTKRKLSLLIFDSTEHCGGYDDDYVSKHLYAINCRCSSIRVTNSSIYTCRLQQSQLAHAHECFDFIIICKA